MEKNAYEIAKSRYAELGVNTDDALNKLKKIPVSIHTWQLDDVIGFEVENAGKISAGLTSTGDHPGRAENIEQYRADLEKVLSLVPGPNKKVSLQSNEGDYKGKLADKNDMSKSHFNSWIDWAKANKIGLDMSPSIYSHRYVKDGYSLSSSEKFISDYWIEYCKKNREISSYIGEKTGISNICNIWIPDGSKDITPARYEHRQILKQSLDEIYKVKYPKEFLIDTVESKLFGIGFEFYNTGSLEFYLAYAMYKKIGLTLDTGHFHQSEVASDKLTAILPFLDDIVLHLSRGLRWDSDHVVILNDEMHAIASEIVRAKALDRVIVALDYFDASLNRIGAYVVGARAAQQAFLCALLEPINQLRAAEDSGNYFKRLALMELMKTKPFGAVYDYFCSINNVLVGEDYIAEIEKHEAEVLRKR